MAQTHYAIFRETWPIRGGFSISRGSKTIAEVIRIELTRDGKRGQGECVPYRRYGETLDGVEAALNGIRAEMEGGLGRAELQARLPAGAARNAVDCALWDLDAKLSDIPAWRTAGLPEPEPVITAFTISLASPEIMAEAAARAADRPLLKLKLGGDGDVERVQAVREAAPEARLIVDANEAWSVEQVEALPPRLTELGVELIEQPLPAGADAILDSVTSAVPLCADESFHGMADFAAMAGRYKAVNIKLDKAGGLTEALDLARKAHDMGLEIMVGCMVGTSLAMAPAALLAGAARYVDLDGPLLLERDRVPGMTYQGSLMYPPPPALWG
jgi:L-alanine-DL-glutamate epimerase-like enolase superfamily enzyme